MTTRLQNVNPATKTRTAVSIALMSAALWAGMAMAQSPFDGTWRPDPQRAAPDTKPDTYALNNGVYDCATCTPPYSVKADGTDQSVQGSERYDTMSVKILDDRSIVRIAKQQGNVVAQTKAVVSVDGATLTETQTVSGMAVKPFDFASKLSRVAAGRPGSHAISGEWRLIESDLVNHEEDTTYRITGDTLHMSDRFGRSFTAKLDGSDAPYLGDPQYTSVSLKLIDSRTLEESDRKGGKVVQIARWSIAADGTTMHVRFDNTRGFVQEQSGHKISPAVRP